MAKCRGCGVLLPPHWFRCAPCGRTRDAVNHKRWYNKRRKNNTAWRAQNMARAKLWRQGNAKHIDEYNVKTGRRLCLP